MVYFYSTCQFDSGKSLYLDSFVVEVAFLIAVRVICFVIMFLYLQGLLRVLQRVRSSSSFHLRRKGIFTKGRWTSSTFLLTVEGLQRCHGSKFLLFPRVGGQSDILQRVS